MRVPVGFEPKTNERLRYTSLPMAASSTITKGDALFDNGSGYLVRATSSDSEVRYVAMESKTTGSGETPIIRVIYTDGVLFQATTAGTPAQTDMFTYVDLTDHNTLNDDASSTDVFYLERIVDSTNKIVEGYFIHNIS